MNINARTLTEDDSLSVSDVDEDSALLFDESGNKFVLPFEDHTPELIDALQECITDNDACCLARDSKAHMKTRLAYISEIAREAVAKATGQECPA